MTSKILISEFMDAPAVASLKARFEVDYRPKLVDEPAALAAALPSADAWIVRNRTHVRGDLLAAAARLRVVGRLGVGLDNIDVAACEARGSASSAIRGPCAARPSGTSTGSASRTARSNVRTPSPAGSSSGSPSLAR